MNPQVKLVFQIGLQRFHEHTERWSEIESFKRRVADQACFIVGGCTTSDKRGYCALDCTKRKAYYPGASIPEECFEVELTMDCSREAEVYEFMQLAIKSAAVFWSVDTDWVHVLSTPVMGMHFSIKEMKT